MESTAQQVVSVETEAGSVELGAARQWKGLTPAQWKAVGLMRSHGPVIVTRLGDKIELTLADGAPMFHRRTLQAMVQKDVIVAAGDGLIEGATQSYRLNE